MEQTKGRRAFCIGLSILIALLVWFYANDDTEIEISVNDVPIEFTNEDTTLADKGLMLLSNEEETIDLKLSMPRSTYFKLDPGKIRIVVDLSSVTTTGTQTITYSVLYPRGPRGELLSSSITQKEPTVRSTTIEIGELFRKNVEIRCKVVGNVAEGYIAGTVRMLPETLEVRGQQVDIMQVSYAQVTLNIENATSTVVELLGFELYDFSDQLIRSNRIHPASESIQVTMPVMTVKEVPLTVEFVETPGSRLENVKWALTPIDTITLSGDASTMAAIDEIKLDTLSLADLKAAETFTYDIPLPDGVDNLSGVTSVTLTILFDDIDSLTVDATQFGYENLTTERDVTVVTSTLSVTLRGTMTDGIISAINRDLTVNDRTMNLIQTNAALNNGNSGGPLINCYGQVIGINTMKMSNFYSSSTTVEGIGFAIPIDTAKPIIDELIEKGYVSGRPAIGIDGETLPATYRIYYRLPEGIYVTRVYASSDAAAMGISEGDIITAIIGIDVTTMEQLNRVKNQFTAGQTVTLTIYRSGSSYDVEIILMDRANA